MTIRRNRDATRARLLDAARRRFAADGYAATSVRAIAADAGVDAALVFRYFGSKDGIFVAATATDDPATMLGLPPDRIAERLLDLFAGDRPESRMALMALLRSTGRAAGEQRLQATVCEPYLAALMAGSRDADARTRAELVVAWVLGVAVVRELLPAAALRDVDWTELRARSSAVVAALLGTPSAI